MSTPCLALALLFAAPGPADDAPLPLRDLVIRSPYVLLATPLDPTDPRRFRVVDVLRGKGLKRGEVVVPDLSRYEVRTFEPAATPRDAEPRRVALALLFLGKPEDAGKARRYPVSAGGVRFCTEDARVLVPVARRSPVHGTTRYEMEPRPGRSWPSLLSQVGDDAAVVEGLLARRRLARAEERAAALLDWVEHHRREFGVAPGGEEDADARVGWGDLEGKVFDWILRDCRPEQAWSALRLRAEVSNGELSPLSQPVFSTPERREWLADRALDRAALPGDRVRALRLLVDPLTLTGGRPLAEPERGRLLGRLTPLLARDESGAVGVVFRTEAARAVGRLSDPGGGLPAVRTALEALTKAYRGEVPGPSRDELAGAICPLATAREWEELTGNPPGVLVRLCDFGREEDRIHFWVSLRPGSPPVLEQPTILLQRMGVLGTLGETKRIPLNPVNLPRAWAEGWTGAEFLLAEVPVGGLTAGTWRVCVQGTVGKEKAKWASEPRRFVAEATPRR